MTIATTHQIDTHLWAHFPKRDFNFTQNMILTVQHSKTLQTLSVLKAFTLCSHTIDYSSSVFDAQELTKIISPAMRHKYLQVLCLLPLLLHSTSSAVELKKRATRGVMDNFGDGIKLAGQMFGINTAADVANLVAKAFSSTPNRNKVDLLSMFQQRQQQANSQQQDTDSQEQLASEQQQQQDSSEAKPTATPAKEQLNVDFSATRLVTSMLRMIGFDATKLGALAINALIMIAQAIGNTFMSVNNRKDVVTVLDGERRFTQQHPQPTRHRGDDGDGEGEGEPESLRGQAEHQPRTLHDDTPLDWFLDQPNESLKKMLAEAIDTQLTDRITQMIERAEGEPGQGACLKMLMCKSAPIIWGMQRSVDERITGKASKEEREQAAHKRKWLSTEPFFTHFPSIAEFQAHGKECEQRFSNQCNTTIVFEPEKPHK